MKTRFIVLAQAISTLLPFWLIERMPGIEKDLGDSFWADVHYVKTFRGFM